MKINILGGGPGGLYASLLLKKAHPDWDITVFERNPEGATYGWGVVFSDATLSNLREADSESYEEITDNFVIWNAIDTYYKGELIRCSGHVFAGIARVHLLNLLQKHAESYGVEIHWEVEIDDPSELADNADVFIAADGVNSLTRDLYAEHFKPTVTEGDARFVWFGTDLSFDSFTFIFRENEHGLFTVHAYPFDGTTSTFIVECRPETWHAAGLDEATEDESLAYCEDLFADHLGSHRLLSNRSLWFTFDTVKCRNWSYDNIVLLGDSAHTAHFSVGSGTKLAMEDAIALAEAFQDNDTIKDAFSDFELARKPRVEGLQQAAAQSQTYFEHVARYTHLDPEQFTFHLLTRSGRIGYDNLRIRDAYFVNNVDRWFAGTQAPNGEQPIIATPPMFMPFSLRDVTLNNRVVLSPRPTDSAEEGAPSEQQAKQLLARARGGAGLVLTEPVAISADGRVTPGTAGMYAAEHEGAWTDIVEQIHASSNASIGLHLLHAGRRGATRSRATGLDRPLQDGWPVIAPSPIPYAPQSETPRAMDREDMDQVRADFVYATEMAEAAGFDLVQLHFGHGYLLNSFISPLTNQREDEYGGSLENRMRFPLEVFEAVRAAWPDERPLAVTLSASDWAAGGIGVDDAFEIARILRDHGCDLFAVVAGQTVFDERPDYDTSTLGLYAEWMRNEVKVPTMSTSFITTSDAVNTLVAGGRADLCMMWPPGAE